MRQLKEYAPADIDSIVLFAPQEYNFYDDSRFKKLAEYGDKHNIPFYCVANVPDTSLLDTGYKSVRIVSWRNYWLSSTVKLTTISPAVAEYAFPFICMNRRAHPFRCALMDALSKYDLINKGAVSWLRLNLDEESGKEKYEFKYWTPREIKLSDSPANPLSLNMFNLPGEYNRSFMHLVTETSDKFNALTEKTIFPLLSKMPFLVLSGPDNCKMLRDYGFQLYDEIFDYSFDSIHDINSRADTLACQMAEISSKPFSELTSMKELIRPKLEYNATLARKLALDLNGIPEIVMQAYQDPTNIYCSRDVIEFMISNQ